MNAMSRLLLSAAPRPRFRPLSRPPRRVVLGRTDPGVISGDVKFCPQPAGFHSAMRWAQNKAGFITAPPNYPLLRQSARGCLLAAARGSGAMWPTLRARQMGAPSGRHG